MKFQAFQFEITFSKLNNLSANAKIHCHKYAKELTKVGSLVLKEMLVTVDHKRSLNVGDS